MSFIVNTVEAVFLQFGNNIQRNVWL